MRRALLWARIDGGTGTAVLDDQVIRQIELLLDVDSLHTGVPFLARWLCGTERLDAAHHPHIRIDAVSSSCSWADTVVLDGTFEIRGRRHQLHLDGELTRFGDRAVAWLNCDLPHQARHSRPRHWPTRHRLRIQLIAELIRPPPR
ncbi:polyisoprenoid-binding protein YceI [Amycolatopsis bartoniae]|uniref:Lipid/polyisoprenoid-binding YceI-like domain-containing protein n=1 Tax=Amycolatopsis bartoniae TaxID=941986 RepID=A0A8H9J005_9PSEU|nr:YceI family protein [Amycolatopsis bartoniae]MBB2939475.1 polyisoprenoid-binding protein YceI [Amycolatopsis bartoniae]GHF66628.1 hypothetical protein GCM10017566_45550 [Amycolatopsis bartoniae]